MIASKCGCGRASISSIPRSARHASVARWRAGAARGVAALGAHEAWRHVDAAKRRRARARAARRARAPRELGASAHVAVACGAKTEPRW